jgi:hypothetical protein
VSVARKASLRAVAAAAPTYQLRVELKYLKPPIWRRLLVPGSIKLSRLHAVLQAVMGWHGGHLHEFIVGGTHYGRPDPDWPDPMPALREDRATLAAALGGVATFTYLYDFGDGWEHKIKVEKVLAPDPQLARPLCIVGVNACPPEDVGGPPGYVEFLQAIRNPNHEEHAAMLEWCGGGFDPTAFDIDAVHERLAEIKL